MNKSQIETAIANLLVNAQAQSKAIASIEALLLMSKANQPAKVEPAAIATAAKVEPAAKTSAKRAARGKKVENEPLAPSQLTFKVYLANRAAKKVNPAIELKNDYHKQGLSVKQAENLLTEFNKISGYKPKAK